MRVVLVGGDQFAYIPSCRIARILRRNCAKNCLAQYRRSIATWALCALILRLLKGLQFLRNLAFCVDACGRFAQKNAIKNCRMRKKNRKKSVPGFEPGTFISLAASLPTQPSLLSYSTRKKIAPYIQRMRKFATFAWKMQFCKFDACVDACVEFAQIYFLRNCVYCAKFGAYLQSCALKIHFFAPHITGFWAVG